MTNSSVTIPGMTLRQWYAGQALANPSICTGVEQPWEIDRWFGKGASNITKAQIFQKQAFETADAMIAALKETGDA